MLPFHSLTVFGLAALAVKATNTSGDPTDLSNWPPCAVSYIPLPLKPLPTLISDITDDLLPSQQTCIPQGLTGPAGCNSLSNITCICQNPAFAPSIGGCEASLCSSTENARKSLPSTLMGPLSPIPPFILETSKDTNELKVDDDHRNRAVEYRTLRACRWTCSGSISSSLHLHSHCDEETRNADREWTFCIGFLCHGYSYGFAESGGYFELSCLCCKLQLLISSRGVLLNGGSWLAIM